MNLLLLRSCFTYMALRLGFQYVFYLLVNCLSVWLLYFLALWDFLVPTAFWLSANNLGLFQSASDSSSDSKSRRVEAQKEYNQVY